MGTMASQITSLTIVYSIVYSDADQIKHQSSSSLAFVRGIRRRPVNSPHKWPVTRKMFLFDDFIMHFYLVEYLCHLPHHYHQPIKRIAAGKYQLHEMHPFVICYERKHSNVLHNIYLITCDCNAGPHSYGYHLYKRCLQTIWCMAMPGHEQADAWLSNNVRCLYCIFSPCFCYRFEWEDDISL